LALEENCEYRSEYENGEIIAMAGGSLNHQQIIANFTEFLGSKVRGKRCRVLPTEMKIWIEDIRKFYYPDVTVICDKPKFYKKRDDTIENPKIIIEVLSKSTEAKDRGEKFYAYRTLDSLEEYVLISQDKILIEKYTKQSDGSWKFLATIGFDSVVEFKSVGITLKLSEIYDFIEFEEEK
jgi:Uma2 family endonuclease